MLEPTYGDMLPSKLPLLLMIVTLQLLKLITFCPWLPDVCLDSLETRRRPGVWLVLEDPGDCPYFILANAMALIARSATFLYCLASVSF